MACPPLRPLHACRYLTGVELTLTDGTRQLFGELTTLLRRCACGCLPESTAPDKIDGPQKRPAPVLPALTDGCLLCVQGTLMVTLPSTLLR